MSLGSAMKRWNMSRPDHARGGRRGQVVVEVVGLGRSDRVEGLQDDVVELRLVGVDVGRQGALPDGPGGLDVRACQVRRGGPWRPSWFLAAAADDHAVHGADHGGLDALVDDGELEEVVVGDRLRGRCRSSSPVIQVPMSVMAASPLATWLAASVQSMPLGSSLKQPALTSSAQSSSVRTTSGSV